MHINLNFLFENSFIHFLIHLFVNSFLCLFNKSFFYSLAQSLFHSSFRSPALLINSFFHSIHWLTFIYSCLCLFTLTHTDSLVHSLTHKISCSPTCLINLFFFHSLLLLPSHLPTPLLSELVLIFSLLFLPFGVIRLTFASIPVREK